MKFAVCITTMNRPESLEGCLKALWNSTVKPHIVIVSDNSPEAKTQQRNQSIAASFQHTIYLEGPRTGVSANRNNALAAIPVDIDRVMFLADDIHVDMNFFELSILYFSKLDPSKLEKTILTGDNKNEFSPPDIGPLGVGFRGYFCPWHKSIPQVVNLYATVFPKSFLDQEKWDQNIFLGQEDIELSLRAAKQNYNIFYCPELKVFDTLFSKTSLPSSARGTLKDYEIYVAASRLYIGIKRYKYIFPNTLKLSLFRVIFYLHMTIYLFRRKSLHCWPKIIHESNVHLL